MEKSGCNQDSWVSISVMLESTLDLLVCSLDCILDFVVFLEFLAHKPATLESNLATKLNALVMEYTAKQGLLVQVIEQDSMLGCSQVKIQMHQIEPVRKQQHEESYQSRSQE